MAAPGIDIDDDSVKLILELQLADLKELSGGQSGDGDFATAAYYSDLESLATFSADRAMCESMSRAIAQDRKIINSDEMRDNRASTTAPNVAQNRDEPENGEAAVSALINEEWLDKLEALYVGTESYAGTSHINGHDENPAEVNRILTKDTTRRCISCLNDMPYLQVARCPCSHEYCLECLVNLFRSATKDESLYPPRCCLKTIGLDVVQIFLPSDLVQTLREKHVEFSTINRIYCYDPSCSTFINPEIGIQGHEGTCPACQSKTCVLCKTALHQGEDCPDDTATQEVLQMASAEGWQRCNACRRLIELDTGCHHMTCVCGSEFCYLCAVAWKQCQCPRWDEARLIARAEGIVERNMPRAPPAETMAQVRRVRNDLIANHECTHAGLWRSVEGPHRCEQRRDMLPQFIYECRQCRVAACRRCRRNRL